MINWLKTVLWLEVLKMAKKAQSRMNLIVVQVIVMIIFDLISPSNFWVYINIIIEFYILNL